MNQPEFIIEYNTAPKLEEVRKTCYGCRRLNNETNDECICYNVHKIKNKDLEKQIIRYNIEIAHFWCLHFIYIIVIDHLFGIFLLAFHTLSVKCKLL